MSLADELNESGVKLKYVKESGDFVADGGLPDGVVLAGSSGDVKNSEEAAFFDSSSQRWFKLG
jgi:hypothetical protein